MSKLNTREQDPRWVQLTIKYLQHLLDECQLITRAVQTCDLETVRAKAHRIKGTAGTYKLGDIAVSAADLEKSVTTSESEEMALQALKTMAQSVHCKMQELNSETDASIPERTSCD